MNSNDLGLLDNFFGYVKDTLEGREEPVLKELYDMAAKGLEENKTLKTKYPDIYPPTVSSNKDNPFRYLIP